MIPPRELLRRLSKIHGSQKIIQTYFCVTEGKRCWEARGLRHSDEVLISLGEFSDRPRDFSKWLNAWAPVARLNR